MRDDLIQPPGAQNGAMIAWTHDLAPFGVMTTDAELRIQFWNQWLEVHTGLGATTVLGRELFEVFPELPLRGLDLQYRRALAGEVSVLSTALHGYLLPMPPTVRDAGYKHMLQTARIAPLSSGQRVVGTLSVIEDVTEREFQAGTLRGQHERDRLLSWALARLLQSADPLKETAEIFARVALSLNFDAYLNHLLEPDGAALGLHAAGGLQPAQRERVATLPLGAALSGRCAEERAPVLVNHLQRSTDPQSEIFRSFGMQAYAAFPLMIGEKLLGTLAFATSSREMIAAEEVDFLSRLAQYVAIAMDRALREEALRDAQARLREHADTLEAKIAERTAKLHETIVQLESFSYTVAHDLRAPIRSLTSFSEIVLEEYRSVLPEQGQFLLQRIMRASQRLEALTRDLLRFSKVSLSAVQLVPVNLDELVHEVIQFTPALAETVKVHPDLGVVWAQPTLLGQCLSNLFDNAVKFAAPGRTVRITVRSEVSLDDGPEETPPRGIAFSPARMHAERGAGAAPAGHTSGGLLPTARLRLWIEDNGIGIAGEAHEKIFGIFERVSGVEGVEGTGIGLAIVARAMERMGGTCGVESELGRGSRFWLELASAS